MKVIYSQVAQDDLVRQFRYYLVELDLPDVALRFREAVRRAITAIGARPLVAPRYVVSNRNLRTLRSWPVTGFKTIRIYFLVEDDAVRIIRILHGKRNVRAILEREINQFG